MTSDSRQRLRLILLLAPAFMGLACTQSRPGSGLNPSAQVMKQAQKRSLMDVREAVPGIVIDMKYGTTDNVTARPIYPARMPCLLRTETAAKLKKAQELLRAQGYGLCIWDAYRPPEAQEVLHKAAGSTGMYLSPNSGWSRHCGGIAVDLTLVDAKGRLQRMPTGFDQDFAHAGIHYQGSDPLVRQNLQILNAAMKEAGFTQLESEWWHFDDADYITDPQPVVFAQKLGLPLMTPAP